MTFLFTSTLSPYDLDLWFSVFRYIFVSVSTTTFLWIVFLPSYFNTFYSYHQASILAFCLLLNATITLLALYAPKLYAIYFVDESDLQYYSTQGGSQKGTVGSTLGNTNAKRNQIEPMTE